MKSNYSTKDYIWEILNRNRLSANSESLLDLLIIYFAVDFITTSAYAYHDSLNLHISNTVRELLIVDQDSKDLINNLSQAIEIIENDNENLLKGTLSTLMIPYKQSPHLNVSLHDSIERILSLQNQDNQQTTNSQKLLKLLIELKPSIRKHHRDIPKGVIALLISLLKQESVESVYDPFAGSGKLLVELATRSKAKNAYGAEPDQSLWLLGKLNLILSGINNENFLNNDAIVNPSTNVNGQLQKVDLAVSIPPFGRRFRKNDVLLSDKFNRFNNVAHATSGDFVYLSHILASLNKSGKAAVVVPNGVLFRGGKDQKIREHFLKNNVIEAVINLPTNIFSQTAIQTAILIFDLGRAQSKDTSVLFIDASDEFTKVQRQNILTNKNIALISSIFLGRLEKKGISKIVSQEEIANNNFNLAVQQFTATPLVEAKLEPKIIKEKIIATEKKLKQVQNQIAELLINNNN